MQALGTQQPDWRPGYIPRLSYRNAAPPEEFPPRQELDNLNESPSGDANTFRNAGPTVRDIRKSMVVPSRSPAPSSVTSPTLPQKKKGSIFGGLFAVKEPTQVALNQVAAQMIAQHGSTNAAKVPHVRLEKMPQFVPKVNTKWDGVPESIKARDRPGKERQRATTRQSPNHSSPRARSIDSSLLKGRGSDSNLFSSSTTESMHSRGKSIHSQKSDPRNPNPHRFYAISVNSSGDLASQQREKHKQESQKRPASVHSQSLRSPSSTNLPEITAFFPVDMPAPPPLPAKYRDSGSIAESEPDSTNKGRAVHQPSIAMEPPLAADAVPEHTSTANTTPIDRSPMTPSSQTMAEASQSHHDAQPDSRHEEVCLVSSGPNVLSLPAAAKNKLVKQPSMAFLAGEARPLQLPDDDDEEPPHSDLRVRRWDSGSETNSARSAAIDRVAQDLEKRPDSSRARLGLRASILLRKDAAPWEGRDSVSDGSLSVRPGANRSPAPLTPKLGLPKSFGRFGKEKS